jgi:hypothetical protein
MRVVVSSALAVSFARFTANQRKMMLLSLLSFLSLC